MLRTHHSDVTQDADMQAAIMRTIALPMGVQSRSRQLQPPLPCLSELAAMSAGASPGQPHSKSTGAIPGGHAAQPGSDALIRD